MYLVLRVLRYLRLQYSDALCCFIASFVSRALMMMLFGSREKAGEMRFNIIILRLVCVRACACINKVEEGCCFPRNFIAEPWKQEWDRLQNGFLSVNLFSYVFYSKTPLFTRKHLCITSRDGWKKRTTIKLRSIPLEIIHSGLFLRQEKTVLTKHRRFEEKETQKLGPL